jgi:lysophospholipase L1-like esterase
VVRRRGHGLGPALVLGVGYNDAARGFGADLEQVLRAARKRGVQRIVLVTLRQTRPPYRAINRQIRAVARRHADVVVADWHARSRGQRRWIAADGMHLSPVGARALARFLHPFAVRAAQG